MIARLAIIQSHNPNYYYTIQTLTDVRNGKTKYYSCLFCFRLIEPQCMPGKRDANSNKTTDKEADTEFSASLSIRLFEFLQKFQSYLFNFEIKKGETRRVETRRVETGRVETRRVETGRVETRRVETRRVETGRGETRQDEARRV